MRRRADQLLVDRQQRVGGGGRDPDVLTQHPPGEAVDPGGERRVLERAGGGHVLRPGLRLVGEHAMLTEGGEPVGCPQAVGAVEEGALLGRHAPSGCDGEQHHRQQRADQPGTDRSDSGGHVAVSLPSRRPIAT